MILVLINIHETGEDETVLPLEYSSVQEFLEKHEQLWNDSIDDNDLSFELADRHFRTLDYYYEGIYEPPIIQTLEEWLRKWCVGI